MSDFKEITYQQWKEQIIADLKGKNFEDTLVWKTNENIDIQPFYMQNALDGNLSSSYNLIPENCLNWEIKEQIFTSQNDANNQVITALKGGCNSIEFVGEIHNIETLNKLLKNIQLDIIQLGFYTNEPLKTATLFAQYVEKSSYTNVKANFFSDDIYKDVIILSKNKYVERNILIKPNSTATIFEQLTESFVNAVNVVDFLTDNGISATEAWSKIAFHFSVHNNYFFEIAKFRAARILYQLILEQYQLIDSKMFINAVTTLPIQTEIDIHNNTIAATTQAMSAIIGGCNSLTVNPFNSIIETPSVFSKRIARNIQLILKEEAFLGKVIDPSRGTYYIETLTDNFVEKVLEKFKNEIKS